WPCASHSPESRALRFPVCPPAAHRGKAAVSEHSARSARPSGRARRASPADAAPDRAETPRRASIPLFQKIDRVADRITTAAPAHEMTVSLPLSFYKCDLIGFAQRSDTFPHPLNRRLPQKSHSFFTRYAPDFGRGPAFQNHLANLFRQVQQF